MYKRGLENILITIFLTLIILLNALFYYILVKNGSFIKYYKSKTKEVHISNIVDQNICWLNDLPSLKIPDYFKIKDNIVKIKKINIDNVTKVLQNYNNINNDYYLSKIRECSYLIITSRNNVGDIYKFIYNQANLGKEIIVYTPVDQNKETLQDKFCLSDIKEEYEGPVQIIYGAFVIYDGNSYKLLTDELNGYQHIVYFMKNNNCYDHEVDNPEGLCIPLSGEVIPRKYVDENGNVYWDLYKYGDKVFLDEFGEYYTVGKNFVYKGFLSKTNFEKIYSFTWNTLEERCNQISKRVLFKIKPLSRNDRDYPYVIKYSYGLGDIFIVLSTNPKYMIPISKYIIQDY